MCSKATLRPESLQCGGQYRRLERAVWIHLYKGGGGTFGTIKIQFREGAAGTWDTFYPDGVEATYTTDRSILMDLPGGLQWSFLGDGSTASMPLRIDGNHILLL